MGNEKNKGKILGIKHGDRGFTLVLSVLVASLMLSIGVSILNISIKETVLSAAGRDSQIAFHAADTGMECALYWDLKSSTRPFDAAPSTTFTCNGETLNQQVTQTETGSDVHREFEITLDEGSGCVTVNVDKVGNVTTVRSRGHNTCNDNDPRRIERGIQTTY